MQTYLNHTVMTEAGDEVQLSSLCQGITLCVFLRHWGCAECSLLLHRLDPRLKELVKLRVRIILIGLGSREGIATFRSKHRFTRRDLLIVTDPTLTLHNSIGLKHGIREVSGGTALYNRVKLKLQGFTNELGDGDPLQQGGAILLDTNANELWRHINGHFGDILDPNSLMDKALVASALQNSNQRSSS